MLRNVLDAYKAATMTFTDDDLARLKSNFRKYITKRQTIALLARLEAAERCLTWNHEEPGFYDAIQEWRKAAGLK